MLTPLPFVVTALNNGIVGVGYLQYVLFLHAGFFFLSSRLSVRLPEPALWLLLPALRLPSALRGRSGALR